VLRRVLVACLICLSLSCASGGSTADETSDPDVTPDRHLVRYSASGGRYQVSYVSAQGPRKEIIQGSFLYGYWADSGDTARVTVRRLGESIPKSITVRLEVDRMPTQPHFILIGDFEPLTLEAPIP